MTNLTSQSLQKHDSQIINSIEKAFTDFPEEAAEREELSRKVQSLIEQLDKGELSVVEHINPNSKGPDSFAVHAYLKQAILLYFRLQKMEVVEAGPFRFVDKIPLKTWTGKEGVRVVPQALVRVGAFVESSAILMPSYTNIGARVGAGTMVDTWATVGSCAWVGKRVHLSGGVGVGGVLEPVQARPVIIEDDVFVGSRCILVEGVHVEAGAVLGAGVTLTASTKIIDVTGSEPKIFTGRVPERSVVIPGTQTKQFQAGNYGVPCALIIGTRKASTDLKTSLTQALRDYDVAT